MRFQFFNLILTVLAVACNAQQQQQVPWDVQLNGEINNICSDKSQCVGDLVCTNTAGFFLRNSRLGSQFKICACPEDKIIYKGNGVCEALPPPPLPPTQRPAPVVHDQFGPCQTNANCYGQLQCFNGKCDCQASEVYLGSGVCTVPIAAASQRSMDFYMFTIAAVFTIFITI